MAFPTITSQNELAVQRFANSLFELQLGSTTMDLVMGDIAALGSSDAAFNNYYSYVFGSMTTVAVADVIAANYNIIEGQYGLDATAVTAAKAAIAAFLDSAPAATRGAVVADLNEIWASLASDVTYGAAATAWNSEITAAVNYTGEADTTAGDPNTIVTDFFLSANQDIITGTGSDDMFYADVVQVDGPQVNSLATGDSLNGGLGLDMLHAQVTEGVFMGGGNMPIQPRTASVEEVRLEALFSNVGLEALDLNLGSLLHDLLASPLVPPTDPAVLDAIEIINDTSVYVSAKRMAGVDFIGSDHSDADLTIMDLTVDEGELTSSMTIGMAYTGNSDHVWDESDLRVYFDEDDLLAGTSADPGAVYYWILDEIAWDVTTGVYVPPLDSAYRDQPGNTLPTGDDLLWRNDRNGVSFVMGGNTYEVTIGNLVATADYRTANDHPAYVAMLNAELAAMQAVDSDLAGLSFSLDQTLVRTTQTDFNQTAIVPAIVLVDSNARTLSNPEISRDQGATGYFDVFGDVDDNPPVPIDLLISVNVELEKVGRGGDGGELVIGGMNKDADNEWGDGSDLKPAGVEQFDVTVMGGELLPNSLASLKSTNNALQVVNIVSDAAQTGTFADLIIGNSNTDAGFDPILGPYQGLGTLYGNAQALKDVQTLDASGFKGDLTVYAALTDEVVAKYMDLKDFDIDPALDNAEFDYTLGQANDMLNLVISKSNLQAAGTTTREDFELVVNGLTGNDTITVKIGDGIGVDGDVWYENSRLDNRNPLPDLDPSAYLVINADDGDDTVSTPGAGDFVINAGLGADTVYAENTGAKAFWVFNADNAATLLSDANDPNPGIIEDILAPAGDADQTATFTVTVDYSGFESTVSVEMPANLVTGLASFTDLQLNQMVKDAINNDGILNELLSASDGPANILRIDALVTELTGLNTLTITVDDEDALSVPVVFSSAAVNYPTWSTTFTAGGLDANASDNIINPGTGDDGNDVLVLGTSALDEDIVKFTGFGPSNITSWTSWDTLVNFNTAIAVAGSDLIDVTSYDADALIVNAVADLWAVNNDAVFAGAAGDTAIVVTSVISNADGTMGATEQGDVDHTNFYLIAEVTETAAGNDTVKIIGVVDLGDAAVLALGNFIF